MEHEAGHGLVADQRGWPRSRSVWAAAHGTGQRTAESAWPQRVKDEEHLVVSLQRAVNLGVRDACDRLSDAFGERLPEVARRFVATARPWLGSGHAEPVPRRRGTPEPGRSPG